MAEQFPISTLFIVIFFILSILISTMGYRLRDDPEAIKLASSDYGHILRETPAAVLYPTSINDISSLIKFSNNVSTPFNIAARGHGHSTMGQAMAKNGVVVDMTSLKNHRRGPGTKVSRSNINIKTSKLGVNYNDNSNDGYYVYADVGGEQLWIDVLHATLEHGLAPVSWTDYLYLTVGGTLSNAGISGTTFRFGPQITNVYELDVVTGQGDLVTCSAQHNSELFFGVLGGLGQFGIITRARIALEAAPKRVKWVRILYSDFSAFSGDQERLISINGRKQSNALDYLEGSLLLHQGPLDNWRTSFFPQSSHSRIISLVAKHRIIYCIEVAKYYDDHHTEATVEKELEVLFKGLSFIPGFLFEKDVAYVDFVNRVGIREEKLQSEGQRRDVNPHPWLNLFVPRSQISDFDAGVLKGIVPKRNITTGLVLLYPMNRTKWNERMSAVIPEEDVFYTVGFLHSSGFDDWEAFDQQNKEILEFCASVGIEVKQYLPHYKTQDGWINHFGLKWNTFQKRKALFDPKRILSPGQRIFNKY